MSKPRPWLPNATPLIVGGVGFDPDAAAWAKIEASFGLAAPFQESDRAQLTEIGSCYIALRQIEFDPPLASMARDHVDAVEEAALALQAALHALMSDGDVADRVARLFGYALREVHTKSLRHGIKLRPVFLDEMEADARKLLGAADRVRKKLELPGSWGHEIETKAGAVAWNWLVEQLAEFVEARGMIASARKDDSEIPSPFVNFVLSVQNAIPADFQQHTHSTSTLAKYISLVLASRPGGTDNSENGSLKRPV